MLKAYNYLSQIKSLIKNSFALMLVKILGPLCSFVIIIFISRKLGAPIVGAYLIAYNLYLIFYSIALLGLGNFATREIARNKGQADKYIINLGFIGLVSSFLCFILICIIACLLDYSWEIKKATYFLSLALFPAVGTQLCESVFIAFEKTKYLLFALILEVIFTIALSLSVLFLGYGIDVLMVVLVISKFLGLAACLYFIIRYLSKLHLIIDFNFCRKIVLETTPVFALVMVTSSILFRVDIVILSKLRETIEVSWYGTAYKFIWVSYVFGLSFMQIIFPVISRIFINYQELFEIVCKRVFVYMSILLFPLAMLTGFLSDKLILFFFGERFIPSILALKILTWSIFPVGWASFCGYILYVGNKQKMVLYALSITLVASLISNICLSYYWGYLGTSIATLISMNIWAILMWVFVYNHIFKLNFAQILWRPLASAIFTGGFIFLAKQYISMPILIVPSLIIYCCFLLIFKTFLKEDIILLEKLQNNF